MRPRTSIAFSCLLMIVVIAGCSSSAVSPPAVTRTFTLSAGSIDFGSSREGLCTDTLHGIPKETILTIQNTGSDTLRIDSVTSQSASFSVLFSSSKVAPGDTGSIRIRFCPTTLGSASSSVTMTDNSTNGNTTIIGMMGNGVRYYPMVGSYFTYDFQQVDTGMHPIGSPQTTTVNIIASGITYQGKTNVELTSDSTYFKIEDNGDLSIWSLGFPTYPATVLVDSGWLTLPVQTQGQNLQLLTDDRNFTDSAGESIAMHVRDSASYIGMSSLAVGSRQYSAIEVRLTELASYASGKGELGIFRAFDGYFSPEIGFVIQQARFGGSEVIAGKRVIQKKGSGDFRKLRAFTLR
ncbi:MAG: DUF1573 domain-containing protein [Bacteroidota bacterium]|nr:DUF1573 domain-containing protein [Bacteroidota bacterium]MDP4234246.1 DUF1573 domain-containing protein [Bacteroidota bacterium]MDP4243436.1 DUF1573 domain-containing protein [Bacteroidota bacterium]MDP4288135.1 DUF1573 domain-containing protein [Bacteroidota bacterium]